MAAKPSRSADAPKRGKPWLMPVIVGVVTAALAGGGAAWYFGSKAAKPANAEHAEQTDGEQPDTPETPKAPPQYIAIEPAFVVNLADEGGDRYLQVEIQVMSRDATVVDMIKLHNPLIRNRLLMLFSQQVTDKLRTREDKEKLQASALKEVQDVLTEATGKPRVEALYFTSFVTQ